MDKKSDGPTFGINGGFRSEERKININFIKANTKFWLSWHYNTDNSYLLVSREEIFMFKADNVS